MLVIRHIQDKADNPLGVCSIFDNNNTVITCHVRFRQDWLIVEDAAKFFFSAHTSWTSLTEIRSEDKFGRYAGNIDIILVAYDDRGRIIDFGSLEVQAVYISGHIRRAFEYYMGAPRELLWIGQNNGFTLDLITSHHPESALLLNLYTKVESYMHGARKWLLP